VAAVDFIYMLKKTRERETKIPRRRQGIRVCTWPRFRQNLRDWAYTYTLLPLPVFCDNQAAIKAAHDATVELNKLIWAYRPMTHTIRSSRTAQPGQMESGRQQLQNHTDGQQERRASDWATKTITRCWMLNWWESSWPFTLSRQQMW
jgi:hypothetical protein